MSDAHNVIRARVGVPPLVWSDQLARVAQDWTNHLIATGGFSHRPDNRYGENLYSVSGAIASPAQAVGHWAREARGYDVRSNTCSGVCGHYTQIVWGNIRTVGCAVATDRRREVWVCNYDPPGNVIGYRPYWMEVRRHADWDDWNSHAARIGRISTTIYYCFEAAYDAAISRVALTGNFSTLHNAVRFAFRGRQWSVSQK
jgi:pathogenesis-related protein 1